ncbi:hypothetical protein [Deinococcus multiflagellatus]|uniref:hypothetical protein n=1 Tax=Deinococcus multiflagellatus TaxID=1656887 RepID=UPI001CCE9321|nr:hypothetical protein [Deinococcus multiflagellatus]MBZ9712350.1 hypothetical protein [Deinococcus multiflagellatus]
MRFVCCVIVSLALSLVACRPQEQTFPALLSSITAAMQGEAGDESRLTKLLGRVVPDQQEGALTWRVLSESRWVALAEMQRTVGPSIDVTLTLREPLKLGELTGMFGPPLRSDQTSRLEVAYFFTLQDHHPRFESCRLFTEASRQKTLEEFGAWKLELICWRRV